MTDTASGKLIRHLAMLNKPANEPEASEIDRCLVQRICDIRKTELIQAADLQIRETSPAQGLKPFFLRPHTRR